MYSAQEATSRWVGAVRDAGVPMGRGAITGREDHCSGFQDFSHSRSLLLRSFTFNFCLNPNLIRCPQVLASTHATGTVSEVHR
jgi:hypothetical protein